MSSSTSSTKNILPRTFNTTSLPERSEIVEGFRRLISSRYRTYGWIAGAIWISGVLLDIWLEPVFFTRSIISGMQLLGMLLLWYCFHHRYWMLYHFNPHDAAALHQLEVYFETRKTRWDKYYVLRMGAMSILGFLMVMLLVFQRESLWAGITTILFLSLALVLMIKGWLDFSDTILLHDIRRSLRDQPSE